jgi:hypothetical protein
MADAETAVQRSGLPYVKDRSGVGDSEVVTVDLGTLLLASIACVLGEQKRKLSNRLSRCVRLCVEHHHDHLSHPATGLQSGVVESVVSSSMYLRGNNMACLLCLSRLLMANLQVLETG